jgi:uncharacterized protein (TIGR01777 family)
MANSQRIVITGATGQIGRPLSRRLLDAGYGLVVLSRDPDHARRIVPGALDYLAWQPGESGPWVGAIDGAYAVIGLAGAPFFRKWKTKEEFERVGTGSRILANRGLVTAMRAATVRPRVFISASAVGWYGFRDSDDEVTEATPGGVDTWAHGNAAWEAEAVKAEELGIRTVRLRTGIVLSADEGMAASMVDQYRRGFGPIVLPGTQWLPWIHIADEVGLILFALRDERVRGPLNASAPEPARSAEFARAMGRVVGKRVWLRVPGAFMRLALGDVADSVLHNRRMVPRAALDFGYAFRFPSLEPALRDLLAEDPRRIATG